MIHDSESAGYMWSQITWEPFEYSAMDFIHSRNLKTTATKTDNPGLIHIIKNKRIEAH